MVGALALPLPERPPRPLARNSTPTRKARSCCDGFRTALGAFRDLSRVRPAERSAGLDFELSFDRSVELARLLTLDSSSAQANPFLSFSAGSRHCASCLRSRRASRGDWLHFRVDMRSTRDDNRRNRMLENEMLLITGFEDYRILVERSDTTRQLHSADQINRNAVPFLSRRVEEGILNILWLRLGFLFADLLLSSSICAMSFREGNWRQVACRLLQYGLVRRFSTSAQKFFSA